MSLSISSCVSHISVQNLSSHQCEIVRWRRRYVSVPVQDKLWMSVQFDRRTSEIVYSTSLHKIFHHFLTLKHLENVRLTCPLSFSCSHQKVHLACKWQTVELVI